MTVRITPQMIVPHNESKGFFTQIPPSSVAAGPNGPEHATSGKPAKVKFRKGWD